MEKALFGRLNIHSLRIPSYSSRLKAYYTTIEEGWRSCKAITRGPRVLAKVFIEGIVTEARLDQAFHYLLETGIVPNEQAETKFVSWLVNDVEVEECSEIAGMKINIEFLREEVKKVGQM